MIAGRFFVTPHAVRQFIARIAPGLTYEQALGAIIRGLDGAHGPSKRLPSGAIGLRIRARSATDYDFRVVITTGDGPAPAVATILRSRTSRGRKRRPVHHGRRSA